MHEPNKDCWDLGLFSIEKYLEWYVIKPNTTLLTLIDKRPLSRRFFSRENLGIFANAWNIYKIVSFYPNLYRVQYTIVFIESLSCIDRQDWGQVHFFIPTRFLADFLAHVTIGILDHTKQNILPLKIFDIYKRSIGTSC